MVPEPLRGQSFAVLELVFLGGKAAGDELTEPLRALRPVMDTIGMVPPAGIAGIDAFVAAAGPGSGSALVSAEIRHLGGALARPQAGQGSLGTLDCQFMTFGVGAFAFEGAGTVHHRALERIAAAIRSLRRLPSAARCQGGVRPGQPVSRQPPDPARLVLNT